MTKTYKWICRYAFFFILIVTLALWYFYCNNTLAELNKISNNLDFINTATFAPTKAYEHLMRIDLFKELKADVFKAIILLFSCTVALIISHVISNKLDKKRAIRQEEFQRAYNENINNGYNEIGINDNEQPLISLALNEDSIKQKDDSTKFNSDIPSAENDNAPLPTRQPRSISFEAEIDDDIDDGNYEKTMIFTGLEKSKDDSNINNEKDQLLESTVSKSQNENIEPKFICTKCGFSYDKKPNFCARCGSKIQ